MLHGAFASSQHLTHAELLEISLGKLKSLDERYSHIKYSGISHYEHFINEKVNPYIDPDNSVESLNKVLRFYNYNKTSPIITFEELIPFINQFFTFIEPKMAFTILIDGEKDKKILYKSMVQYSIGILFQIQYLSQTNISKHSELTVLKKLVLKNLSPYFGYGGNGPGSLDHWETFFFKLAYAIHSNYPADMIADASQSLTSIAYNEKSKEHDKLAAMKILRELVMFCNSRCSDPVLETNSIGNLPRDEYIKSVFRDWLRDQTNISSDGLGIYREYLNLLKRTNDPTLADFREKLLINDLKHSLNTSIERAKNMFLNRGTAFHFFKEVFSNLCHATKLSIALFLLYPTWIFFITTGFVLLIFTGKYKLVPPLIHRKSAIPRNKHLAFLVLIFDYFIYPIRLTNAAIKSIVNNSIASFKEQNHISYSIGVNSLVIAATLFVTEISSFINLNY